MSDPSAHADVFENTGNTPSLESKINLNLEKHFIDPEYVRLHIQSSGGNPLNVIITLPEDLPYDADMPAIGELRKSVDKIKSLIINVQFTETWQMLVSGIGEGQPAPLLERLVLKDKEGVKDIENNGPFATLSTALTPSPNLVHLQLPAWPLPAQPPPPQLSSVTSLTFDTAYSGLDIPALFPLIQAAPHLQHFTCKAVDYGAESDPNYSNIISVPQLRSANVTIPGFGLDFLGNFDAPLLAEVRLDGYRDGIPSYVFEEEDWGIDATKPASNIVAHLSARSPNIRRLDLHYVHFEQPKEDFNRILSGKAFPALEELVLKMANIPDAALIESAAGNLSLKKLELRQCKYVTIDGLRRFTQERANLEFVLIVEGCPAISEEDIKSLSK